MLNSDKTNEKSNNPTEFLNLESETNFKTFSNYDLNNTKENLYGNLNKNNSYMDNLNSSRSKVSKKIIFKNMVNASNTKNFNNDFINYNNLNNLSNFNDYNGNIKNIDIKSYEKTDLRYNRNSSKLFLNTDKSTNYIDNYGYYNSNSVEINKNVYDKPDFAESEDEGFSNIYYDKNTKKMREKKKRDFLLYSKNDVLQENGKKKIFKSSFENKIDKVIPIKALTSIIIENEIKAENKKDLKIKLDNNLKHKANLLKEKINKSKLEYKSLANSNSENILTYLPNNKDNYHKQLIDNITSNFNKLNMMSKKIGTNSLLIDKNSDLLNNKEMENYLFKESNDRNMMKNLDQLEKIAFKEEKKRRVFSFISNLKNKKLKRNFDENNPVEYFHNYKKNIEESDFMSKGLDMETEIIIGKKIFNKHDFLGISKEVLNLCKKGNLN